jgi:hypothetical protein
MQHKKSSTKERGEKAEYNDKIIKSASSSSGTIF